MVNGRVGGPIRGQLQAMTLVARSGTDASQITECHEEPQEISRQQCQTAHITENITLEDD